jgi:hypothetical protein
MINEDSDDEVSPDNKNNRNNKNNKNNKTKIVIVKGEERDHHKMDMHLNFEQINNGMIPVDEAESHIENSNPTFE